MSFGIKFSEDSRGERLLDENYKNYILKELVDDIGVTPAIFSHRALRYMYDQGMMTSDPWGDYLFFVQHTIDSSGGGGFRLAVFGTDVPSPAGSGFGLSINNAAGELIYDTREKWLNVYGYINGPGLDDLVWGSDSVVDVSSIMHSDDTFMLGNPFMHPFSQSTSGGSFYTHNQEFTYSPPTRNSYDSIVLRMKKQSRVYNSSIISGYVRGFQYYDTSPMLFADLSNLI